MSYFSLLIGIIVTTSTVCGDIFFLHLQQHSAQFHTTIARAHNLVVPLHITIFTHYHSITFIILTLQSPYHHHIITIITTISHYHHHFHYHHTLSPSHITISHCTSVSQYHATHSYLTTNVYHLEFRLVNVKCVLCDPKCALSGSQHIVHCGRVVWTGETIQLLHKVLCVVIVVHLRPLGERLSQGRVLPELLQRLHKLWQQLEGVVRLVLDINYKILMRARYTQVLIVFTVAENFYASFSEMRKIHTDEENTHGCKNIHGCEKLVENMGRCKNKWKIYTNIHKIMEYTSVNICAHLHKSVIRNTTKQHKILFKYKVVQSHNNYLFSKRAENPTTIVQFVSLVFRAFQCNGAAFGKYPGHFCEQCPFVSQVPQPEIHLQHI